MIPFDDDFDMMTSYENYSKLKNLLETQTDWVNLEWCIYEDTMKIFFKESDYAGDKNWKFPFVDIFFYEKNATHICEKNSSSMCSLISSIFPLRLRPMGKYWLPTPNNPQEYLNSINLKDIHEFCVKPEYSHRDEIRISFIGVKFKCEMLKKDYPFVESSCNQTYCIETLRLDNSLIGSIIFKN